MKKKDGIVMRDSGNEFSEINPAWLSWGLFRESGNPAYYLLYKSITEENDEEK